MSARRGDDGGSAMSGRFVAPTIDLRESASVLVEERGSGWADPSDDVVLEGLITALENDDALVR
ncbi:MAG: hypothetical protein QOH26_2146, partial [Actinomycetota bacterium]|nr:hypothetical protein [Actinomycetota bacterium]